MLQMNLNIVSFRLSKARVALHGLDVFANFRISLNNCELQNFVILQVGLRNRVRVKLVKISKFFFQ